jgi:hypothetical protein
MRLVFFNKNKQYLIIGIGLFLVFIFLFTATNLYASNPPLITNVRIVDINNESALVKWETDKEADSLINYGLDRYYGIVRDPKADKIEHNLLLDNLLSGTTYYFRVVSRDEEGNQSISSDYRFTTEGESEIVDVDSSPAERIEKILEQIEDISDILEIQESFNERIREVAEELVIIGTPVVEVGENTAVVRWATNRPSSSFVEFTRENDFDESNPNYLRTQVGSDGETLEHEVFLEGLTPATTYHFRAVVRDVAGIEVRSDDYVFTTDAPTPQIRNFELTFVGEDSAIFEWNTTFPAESLIEYEHLGTGDRETKGSPTLSSSHTVQLTDLEFGALYRAKAIAIGEDGGTSESNSVEFETVIDTEPPVVSNVSTESTLFPGAEARVQTIVSWKTNKLAICRFNYQQGLAPGVDVFDLDPRDSSFMTNHVQVVVEFKPATVYQFWFICDDRFGNEGVSEKFVVFTPQQEKNIIDIIIENFEDTFGWVKNIIE